MMRVKTFFYFFLIITMLLPTISIPADAVASAHLELPATSNIVALSASYQPVVLRGIKPSLENPMQFSFFMDIGDAKNTDDEALKQEADQLIKYFLAALTIPEKDLWVNLSPYEKNSMIPANLAQTAMGRDMLAQDYLLKQITSSLIHPEGDYGKKFWARVYEKARLQGYEDVLTEVSTFNKVWIVPQRAEIYVHEGVAYVHQAYLKVMLEQDYNALNSNLRSSKEGAATNFVGSEVAALIKEIIIPALQQEVNEGEHFAPLRQIFYSMVLAAWYKNNLKEAILNQWYADKSKVGISVNQTDIKINEAIYQQYLASYKKGAFNFIKEEEDGNGQTVLRKYFSGGEDFAMISNETLAIKQGQPPSLPPRSRARLPAIRRVDFNLEPVITNVTPWPTTAKGGVMVVGSFDQMAISPMIGFLKEALAKAKMEKDREWIPLFPANAIDARPVYAQKLFEWAVKASEKFGFPLVLVSAQSITSTAQLANRLQGDVKKMFKVKANFDRMPNQEVQTDWVGLRITNVKKARINIINEIGSWLWHAAEKDSAMVAVSESDIILSSVARNQYGFTHVPLKLAVGGIIYYFTGLSFYEGRPLLRYEDRRPSARTQYPLRVILFERWHAQGKSGRNEIFGSYTDFGNGVAAGTGVLQGDDATTRQLAAASLLKHGRIQGAMLQPTFTQPLINQMIMDQEQGRFDEQGPLADDLLAAYRVIGGGIDAYEYGPYAQYPTANPGDVFIYGVGQQHVFTGDGVEGISFADDELVYRVRLKDGREVYIAGRTWLNSTADSDSAMQAISAPVAREDLAKGGIDFNPALMTMTVSGEVIRLQPIDQQLLNSLDPSQIQGIVPTILRIEAVENVFSN